MDVLVSTGRFNLLTLLNHVHWIFSSATQVLYE